MTGDAIRRPFISARSIRILKFDDHASAWKPREMRYRWRWRYWKKLSTYGWWSWTITTRPGFSKFSMSFGDFQKTGAKFETSILGPWTVANNYSLSRSTLSADNFPTTSQWETSAKDSRFDLWRGRCSFDLFFDAWPRVVQKCCYQGRKTQRGGRFFESRFLSVFSGCLNSAYRLRLSQSSWSACRKPTRMAPFNASYLAFHPNLHRRSRSIDASSWRVRSRRKRMWNAIVAEKYAHILWPEAHSSPTRLCCRNLSKMSSKKRFWQRWGQKNWNRVWNSAAFVHNTVLANRGVPTDVAIMVDSVRMAIIDSVRSTVNAHPRMHNRIRIWSIKGSSFSNTAEKSRFWAV